MSQLFDAHVQSTTDAEFVTPGLLGAVFSGGSSEVCTRQAAKNNAGRWHHAAALACLAGPDDPRFPRPEPDVVDLTVSYAELQLLLAGPLYALYEFAIIAIRVTHWRAARANPAEPIIEA